MDCPKGAGMANLVGKTLGKYKLTERLGSGGMAEVYKAYHPKLERYVTIKILHGYLAEGEDFLARFEREARAVASLRHPHIVQIHDYDVEDDQYYMVMEFIDGGTLQSRMMELAKSGAYMPVSQVLPILGQVAEALDYAHKRGIIHRDIKPSNILLDSAGNAFLADFGIARMMSGTQFTATGSLIGTPTYMSPEQGRGDELTTVSDIYSLGVILYELLTGKAPFTSETTPLAIIHKHIHEPPPDPRSLRPGLPADVEQVVLKALAKESQDRYQNAREMVLALEGALSPELITQLDASGTQESIPRAAMPTVLMEAEEHPPASKSQAPTELISEEMRSELANEPVRLEAAMPEPVKRETESKKEEAAIKTKGSRVAKAPRPKTQERIAAKPIWERLKSRPVLFIVIGVVLVGILILVISSLSGGASCSTLEDCLARANPLRDQGDLAGYLKYIDAALARVPADQHPPHAGLWCDRGDAEKQLGQISQAMISFKYCMDWTQDDPALQPIRDRATTGLAGLH
jgi:serine/threonine protein kinase